MGGWLESQSYRIDENSGSALMEELGIQRGEERQSGKEYRESI